MPIDMFTKRVSNPVSRKRSHQQILQEEDEFDNSPWNDEHDEDAPGPSRAAVKARLPAGKIRKAVATRTKATPAKPRGRRTIIEEDPIELDETDVEEIVDDDDDVPLAVAVASKRKTPRKEIGLGARGKVVTKKLPAKSVAAPWAAFKAGESSGSGKGQSRMGVVGQSEIDEFSTARTENVTPCEKLFDSLQAVYKGVSRFNERRVVSRLITRSSARIPKRPELVET